MLQAHAKDCLPSTLLRQGLPLCFILERARQPRPCWGSAPATSGPFKRPNKTIRLSFIAFVLVAIGASIVALNPALARKALQNRILTSGMHHHPTIIRLAC